jgi:NSS family neurotransmitter:Na+ symporter
MPGGYIISLAFFMLISFAALTSSVSMLEVVVAYWDETHNMHRTKGSILSGSAIFLLGLLTVFSTNLMAEVKVFGLTFFDLFDKMTSSYFLPIGGMAISLFFGWILGPKAVEEILGPRIPKAFHVGLLWCTRLAAPLAVLAVLIYNLK